MVMPRSRSSGALSIESKDRNLMFGLCFESTLVIAAVKVVLPWSMCPIVPTFTCGLDRSNFSFAIFFFPLCRPPRRTLDLCFSLPSAHALGYRYCVRCADCTQARRLCHPNLSSRTALVLGNDLFRDVARRFFVTREVHGVFSAALG